jgi:hypothetical protein
MTAMWFYKSKYNLINDVNNFSFSLFLFLLILDFTFVVGYSMFINNKCS